MKEFFKSMEIKIIMAIVLGAFSFIGFMLQSSIEQVKNNREEIIRLQGENILLLNTMDLKIDAIKNSVANIGKMDAKLNILEMRVKFLEERE